MPPFIIPHSITPLPLHARNNEVKIVAPAVLRTDQQDPGDHGSSKTLNGGIIAAIVIASCIVAGIIFHFILKKNSSRAKRNRARDQALDAPYQLPGYLSRDRPHSGREWPLSSPSRQTKESAYQRRLRYGSNRQRRENPPSACYRPEDRPCRNSPHSSNDSSSFSVVHSHVAPENALGILSADSPYQPYSSSSSMPRSLTNPHGSGTSAVGVSNAVLPVPKSVSAREQLRRQVSSSSKAKSKSKSKSKSKKSSK